MGWRKLGRIFTASGQHDWMMSHASCPQAEHLEEDRFRIWFAPRDTQNRSYTGWIEIDLKEPDQILAMSDKPASWPGGLGEFDEQGAMFSCMVSHQDRRLIYYTGWTTGGDVPWHNAVGRTESAAGTDIFTRSVRRPLLDRSPANPLFVGNPWVVFHNGVWWLWYLRGTEWHKSIDKTYASYNIGVAQSTDGVNWNVLDHVCIDFALPSEMAIARPSVRIKNGQFEMAYSYRGHDFPYRLGFAVSQNGIVWQRQDSMLDVPRSDSGWDSEMIAYPHLFDHKDKTYLVYAGNGFSRDGIGLAVYES